MHYRNHPGECDISSAEVVELIEAGHIVKPKGIRVLVRKSCEMPLGGDGNDGQESSIHDLGIDSFFLQLRYSPILGTNARNNSNMAWR